MSVRHSDKPEFLGQLCVIYRSACRHVRVNVRIGEPGGLEVETLGPRNVECFTVPQHIYPAENGTWLQLGMDKTTGHSLFQ